MNQRTGPDAEKTAAPPVRERLASLDAFRGFDILTMVFVNFIAAMSGIPFILRHAPAAMDAFTLTDWVFPGFLFMVGVSIPLALAKRKRTGEPTLRLVGHVVLRTVALLFLGVIEVNSHRFSAADTGLSEPLWYFLAYGAVFALWAATPKNAGPRRKKIQLGMRIAAAALLIVLVVIFRGKGENGVVTWLQHSWWGILGMIGWTYFAGSFLYIVSKGNRTVLAGAIGFMTVLYIGGRHGALDFLGPVNRLLEHGVGSIFGSHAAIVTAGMLAGTVFLPGSDLAKPKDRVRFLSILGVALLAAGYVLRPLHGFSKIAGTESWALATAGISCLAFLLFYILLDLLKLGRAAAFLVPAGRNPLAAYLLPDQIGNILLLAGGLLHVNLWRAVWPFADKGGWPGMLNAAVLTALVLLLTTLLTRAKVILKL
jgi:heparan-alpha-glucosaminide N-acetyltransferase